MKKFEKLNSKKVESIHSIKGGRAMYMENSVGVKPTFHAQPSDHGDHTCTDAIPDPPGPHDCPGGF
ncbi:hypothetical protein [Pedobacter steynii]|uniref:hypothetical protein n=1 Tax=Pedobacter steynii TaxID=430522 RepID=UPI0012F85D46|nr:hypothetical protein [Pedobacter steynii]